MGINRKRISVAVVAAFTCLSLSACTTRLTDFTIISTKNVEYSKMSDYKRGEHRVEGVDMKHIIFFIPTGTPNVKEAIDRAIESVPGGVALVDGVVYHTGWWIPYIYGQISYTVEGTPLISSSFLK